MFKRLKDQKGFSLIEAIFATTILAVGLVGGMLTLQNSTLHTVNADFSSIATQLANEKIEAILADKEYLGYGYLDAEANYPAEQLAEDFNAFERFVTITEVDPDDLTEPQEGSGVKKINVVVNWGEKDYQTVTVTTLVTDYM
ncbi:MAG: prepilin-type N-terminal cleavage/methylation domain-containing protein [Deltaproteobacteria bacterium]|nr:prepilin-type N-terminal cleavage/methylation domain-containing protein [Deltaproteobacteria bacterium]